MNFFSFLVVFFFFLQMCGAQIQSFFDDMNLFSIATLHVIQ